MKHLCPLCGGRNDCAAESAEPPQNCWCFRAVIPEELLKRIPDPLAGVSCICRRCVEQFHAGSNRADSAGN